MKKKSKATYLDFYKAINLGDDLFVQTILKRYPERSFLIIASPTYSKMLKSYSNVTVISNPLIRVANKIDEYLQIRKYSIKNIVASCCKCTVLVGGSLFIEPYYPSLDNSLFGPKVLFVLGANFGPYKSSEYLDHCKSYISKASDLCFRDEKSYELFKSENNVRYAPDILFGYSKDIIAEGKGILVSVMNFKQKNTVYAQYQEDYEQFLIKAIRKNRFNNEIIHICSFCSIEGDDMVFDSVKAKMSEEEKTRTEFIKYTGYNSEEIVKTIANSRIVIGTRFHSIILGLSMGKQVIPISYSNKTNEMLNDLGFSDSIVDVKNCSRATPTIIKMDGIQLRKLKENSELHFKELDLFFQN